MDCSSVVDATSCHTFAYRLAVRVALLVVTAAVSVWSTSNARAADVDVNDVREGIEAGLQQLRKGVYHIKGTNTVSVGGDVSRTDIRIDGAFDVAAGRFRFDRIRPNPFSHPKEPQLSTKVILTPDHSVYYNSELRRLEIHRPDAKHHLAHTGGIMDIRALSLYLTAGGMFESRMLADVIERRFAQRPAESVEVEGKEVRLRWDHQYSYWLWWFDAANEFRPKRMEEWYTAPDIAEEVRAIPAHTITTKWEKLNGASIPVEYHKVFRSGGVVKDVDGTRKTSFDTKEYDWSIDWDSVNEPIDPALFDYRSLELPKGTYIADGRSGELVVLDIAGTRKVPAVEVDRGMSWTMIILLVNGVIVLTLMAMIISRGIALK